MAYKSIDLFQGLADGQINEAVGGMLVSTRFHRESNYAIFECTALAAVKSIHRTGADSVAFQTDGYKIFLVYEPARYPFRFQEPYLREDDQQIPLRVSELEIFELPNHDRILINRDPYWSRGSITVEAPAEGNFVSFIFDEGDLEASAHEFLSEILHGDFGVPAATLKTVFLLVDRHLKNFRSEA